MKKSLVIVTLLLIVCEISFAQIRNNRRRTNTSGQSEINYASPQEYEIAAITVEGADFLDKNALVSLSGLKVGDKIKIPSEEVSGAIKKLWKHGIIGDASVVLEKIENGRVFLIIRLAERPRLTKVYYEGINKTQEGELNDNINLVRGTILTDAKVKNIELGVKDYFIDKGFLNTTVNVTRRADSIVSNGVQLLVKVDKRTKVKIEKIAFDGNDNFTTNKLKRKMAKTNEKIRFRVFSQLANQIFDFKFSKVGDFVDSSRTVSGGQLQEFINDNIKLNFFKSAKYRKEDFEEDKKALIEFYNSKGFRDAVVVRDTLYNVGNDYIKIDIVVDEGKKYYFRNISWTGNFVHTDETLNSILAVEKGDVYDLEKVNRALSFNPKGADISGLYMDDGYLFFNVQPVEVGIVEDSIDIEMRVFEGTQATINKIIIKGNDRTSDHVILRELRTLPGQKFSRSDIIRTNQRLAQLGYFDPEQIGINPVPNPADGTVDIEYTLVEKPSDQIELSGGWGGAFGFVGTLGLTFNNFSLRNIPNFDKWRPLPIGDGQRLSIRAQANGRQFQSYTFSFSEPWFGGKKPNSFSISLNQSVQRTFNFDGGVDSVGRPIVLRRTRQNEFNATLKLKSASIGYGRQLEWPDNYFVLSHALTFTNYELNNWIPGSLGFTDGNSNSITFNTTLARNSIDNPLFPRSGSSLSLLLSLTPPHSLWRDVADDAPNAEKFKWVEYHKWMFDSKYYITLAGNLVLESRAHFGFIGSYKRDAEIGPFERFELGGDGLAGQNFILGTDIIGMRGYENNTITPPGYGLNRTQATVDQIEGGIVYNKYSMELRYPITTGAAATIFAYVFGEAGNNWNTFEEFNPFDAYRSAGVGARIFMPAFGLIGINWGYGFDTLPGRTEPSGPQFQFTIGQQIR